MIFKIIPLKGTDKMKLNLTSNAVQQLFSKEYIRSFIKSRTVPTDKFSFGHVFYDNNGLSKAIEFYEPSKVLFNDIQLIDQDYRLVENLFCKLDSKLIYEDKIGFISKKYQIGVYSPYKKVESILVGRDGYYK